MSFLVIDFNPDGTAEAVYDDALIDVMRRLGPTTVTRASHVEPHPSAPGWLADMAPSGGPLLGLKGTSMTAFNLAPFPTRQEALDAERDWLRYVKGIGRFTSSTCERGRS